MLVIRNKIYAESNGQDYYTAKRNIEMRKLAPSRQQQMQRMLVEQRKQNSLIQSVGGKSNVVL